MSSLKKWKRKFVRTSSRLILVGVFASLVAVVPVASLWAQLPTTVLNSIYPNGGKQGTSFDVTIAGTNQEGVDALIFSHSGITAEPVMDTPEFLKTARPLPGKFKVTIAPDAAPGVYEARAVGRFGASNPRAFAVGTLEEVLDTGSNKSKETALLVTTGQTITGRVDASSVDYFKMELKKGQRVILDCCAERLDSKLNGSFTCYNTDGLEMDRVHDVVGLDPLLDFTAPSDGEYTFGLYDFLYGGGADYNFRLSFHESPHIDFILPASGEPGKNSQFTVYGRNLPNGQAVEGMTIDGAPLEKTTVNIQVPTDERAKNGLAVTSYLPTNSVFIDAIEYQLASSNTVNIGVARAPVVLEKEPNNDASTAQKVTAPCEIGGQFYPSRDDDWFEFEGKAGEVYILEVISHQFGRDSDPYMTIQKVVKNDKGEEQVSDVAQVDDPSTRNTLIGTSFDTSTDDPSYRLAISQDATYRIRIRDQFGSSRSDPRFVYQLAIRPEKPDFRLVAFAEQTKVANANIVLQFSAVLRKGGTTMVKTTLARRDGFKEDVEIIAEGLPEGVTCRNAILSGTANTAWLIFQAAENAAKWSGEVQIVGKAKIDGQDVQRFARVGTCLWGTTNRTTAPAMFRASRSLSLSVTDEVHKAFVDVGDESIYETSLGGKLDIPIKVTRREDFKDDVKLVATGLPNEVKPADVTVKKDTADGKLAISIANAKAKPGIYTFYLRNDGKYKYVRDPEAITLAEEDQKVVDEVVKSIAEEIKQATAKRDEAIKLAKDAVTALAEAKKMPDNAAGIAEAEKKMNDTKAAQTTAEQALKAAQDKDKRGKAAKAAADKRLAAVKKAQAAKDVLVAIISTPIKLRVHNTPVAVNVGEDAGAVKQGEKKEVAFAIERKFGFEDKVDVTIEPPQGSRRYCREISDRQRRKRREAGVNRGGQRQARRSYDYRANQR